MSRARATHGRERYILAGAPACGGVAEWTIAAVLKTADPQGSVGSNPTPSAMSDLRFNATSESDVLARERSARDISRQLRSRSGSTPTLNQRRRRGLDQREFES